MTGGIVFALVLVLVLPPLFMITGGVLSAVMGWVLRDNGIATHEGSEFVDLNT